MPDPRPIRRLFIGPLEVAGYYGNLEKGFRELGVRCDFVPMTRHRFGYSGQSRSPLLVTLIRVCGGLRSRLGAILGFPFDLIAWCLRILYLAQAALRYDAFIFAYGTSLLPDNRDLAFLKRLGKRVVIVLHGTEVRPSYVDGMIDLDENDGLQRLRNSVDKCRNRVSRLEQSGVTIVGNPLPAFYFAKSRMVNFLAMGLPYADSPFADDHLTAADENQNANGLNGPVRILHCPSHVVGKGTRQFREAVEALRKNGYQIDLIELVGRPNREVIQEIQQCDFVLDQVFSDFPLAGFPTEAAWYGKPAVVGGFDFEQLKNVSPPASWPPSLLCRPDELQAAIEKLIVDVSYRRSLGREAMQYVRSQWTVRKVAERYLRVLNGEIPEEWYWNPDDVRYFHGWGQTEVTIRNKVNRMIDRYGTASLGLGHRPDFETAFLARFQTESELPGLENSK